ncbi:formate dehydrogenase accessory sulfurtransferase FdhD [Desulfonatronovibrio hydrogenovorans]|uniref:formate dehydrogenase accessory sulfurtransferase FdhD n=1 Tax=Desulfonatronovibrio hydrogenovorans TaxID=53245 RepID=UPI00048AFEA6|nr:formate dehydrogenase accessory sulfurtransferase FdhD [Desulfonatronovibrio hydrogenovorans]
MPTIDCSTILMTPAGSSVLEEKVLDERPYTVTLNDETIGSAMVLARDLKEFAAGYLFGQGHLEKDTRIFQIEVCPDGRVDVYADVQVQKDQDMITTSGCGGSGKIARKLLEGNYPELSHFVMNFSRISELVRRTLSNSSLQQETHCVHGCGYLTENGFEACFEDVGRHNAVDKVMGAILLGRFPRAGAVYTTGRLTSDMVLKCARMGIPVVLSRTAPSSLGIEIARQAGITLGAYVRPGRVNVFNAPERIIND